MGIRSALYSSVFQSSFDPTQGRLGHHTAVGNTPLNIAAPQLAWSGKASVASPIDGNTITCDGGAWSGNTSLLFQWYSGGAPITGATSASYTPTVNTIGSALRCDVTAVNIAGSRTVSSLTTNTVLNRLFASLDFRATVGSEIDPPRAYAVTSADAPPIQNTQPFLTTIGRVSSPPNTQYNFGIQGTISFNEGTSGGELAGAVTMSGGTGRVWVPNVPVGVPIRIKAALGPYSSIANIGMTVYDGDPSNGGTVITNGIVVETNQTWANPLVANSVPANTFIDITGQVFGANTSGSLLANLSQVWDSLNYSVQVTSQKGSLYFVKGTGPTTYLKHLEVGYMFPMTPEAGVGPYYVDYLNGNDANDGLTHATAWQHGPGDPNAGAYVANFIPRSGATIYWEGNQDHFLASYVNQLTFHAPLSCGGYTGSHVTHTSRPGTGRARWRGDEIQPTGWATASTDPLVGAANAAAIAEKLVPSYPGTCFQQFLTAGGKRLYPAQYPIPTAPSCWEVSDSGSPSYTQLTSAQYNAAVTWNNTTNTATLIDSTFFGRYGLNGLAGYVIAHRITGNLTNECVISSGPMANGMITWTNPAGNAPWNPGAPGGADLFYCIRYHPRDLEMPGQYAWTTDWTTCYGTFGTTFSGARGITRLKRFIDLNVSHLTFDSLDMRYTAGPILTPFNDAGIAILMSGNSTALVDDITISNCAFSGYQCPARPPVIGIGGNGLGIGAAIANCSIDDAQGRGVSVTPNLANTNVTVTNLTATRIGRTVDYTGQNAFSANDNLNISTHQNIRGSNSSTFHGNGLTTYVETHNSNFFNIEMMNHSMPVTSQASAAITRNNHWKGVIATGRRTKPGLRSDGVTPWNPNTSNVSRFDGGETNSTIEQYLSALSIGSGAFFLQAINGINSAGLSFKNCVFDTLTNTPNALVGVTFENVLLLGPSYPNFSVSALWSSSPGGNATQSQVMNVTMLMGDFTFTGSITNNVLTVTSGFTATVTGSGSPTTVTLGTTMPVTGTGVGNGCTILQQLNGTPGGMGQYQVTNTPNVGSTTLTSSTKWNGVFTSLMQQYLTQIPNGTGVNNNYQNVTMGLNWFVPLYGANFTLADCDIDNHNVVSGWPADIAFASIINTQVDSVLDLPLGAGDNNLFYIDRGQVCFVSNAPLPGTYWLNVRQTNFNSLVSGSTTHITALAVTVS